jgi:hypothetical protein
MLSLLKNSKNKIGKWLIKSINSQVFHSHHSGIKELDTGLSLPTQWNLAADSKAATEQPLQVARCNKIIKDEK